MEKRSEKEYSRVEHRGSLDLSNMRENVAQR